MVVRCASSTGYLYMFELYIGWKKDVETNLEESVLKQLSQKLKEIYYTLFFNNFFKNSPALINKLFEDGIYAEGT